MIRRLAKLAFAGIVCALLVVGLVQPGSAQAPVPTATPAPVALDPNLVTFEMLKQPEIQMVGPIDSVSFLVSLPANWKLQPGASMDLMMGVAISSLAGAARTPASSSALVNAANYGATLSVTVNNTLVSVANLDQSGEMHLNVPISDQALKPARPDGRMIVTFGLDARFACYAERQFSVAIHPTSSLSLPHDSTALSTNLANFPQPVFQGSFAQDSALLVVPDQPSATDLQEALTIAAGLGRMSGNTVLIDIVPLGQLTAALESKNHLIFVGKAASLQSLSALALPVSLSGGQFKAAGSAADDGLVQMIQSPWSPEHVVMVASGNSDAGALKAAQAVSAGKLFTVQAPNVSIVQQVQPFPVAAPRAVDQTLSDLGYTGRTFTRIGVDTSPYTFFLPPGSTLGPDAEFNLIYGHSALLNYDRSGIVVLLNNIPIGSVRFRDETAAQPTNSIHIPLPAAALVPGQNTLSVKANIIPNDNCSPINLQGGWVQIWPQSTLHLPLSQSGASQLAGIDLGRFPAPFMYDSTLASTAFVMPKNDLTAWRAAVQIASLVGGRSGGPLAAPAVYFGDNVPQADRAKYNMLIVGVPSQLPIMADLNSALPVPFASGSDTPGAGSFQVTYRIPSGSPAGFLELMPSPWNASNMVLAVVGNTSQGVAWAGAALTDPLLRPLLAGNFDVINGTQVLTSDTLISSVAAAAGENGGAPAVEAVPPAVPSVPVSGRPAWLLPLIIVAVLAGLAIVALVLVNNWMRNRKGHATPPDREP